jgi:cellulose synthase/poly-beta-1,6-N-acetylglucosamine synthase-like glycosyltransferase
VTWAGSRLLEATPRISVVVPAFQAAATIEQCVLALLAQTLPREEYEVIVVDDGSSDDTASRAEKSGARVVRLASNLGPGAARNAGVAVARGEVVVFTDADCEPTPPFLAALTEHMRDPDVGGTKGVYLTKQRALVARFVQYEYESRYRHTARHNALDFVDTYACCFRRADLNRIGGFDARLRVCEDQEMSFRMAEAGVRVRFAPDARTYHFHCANLGAYMRKKFHIARWKMRVLRRHPSKALHDSHTPQSLKAEVAMAYAVCLALTFCAVSRRRGVGWLPLGAAVCAYLPLVAPSVARNARQDPALALAAPAISFGRDLALGAGLGVGLLEAIGIFPVGAAG